jgi:hypothetical protein
MSVKEINWLMMFRGITVVCSENCTKDVNALCLKVQSYKVCKKAVHTVGLGTVP